MANKQEDKLKKVMEEEEAKRKKALGIKSEEEMQEIEKKSRKEALADRLKKSASAKGSVGTGGSTGKTGDLYKPGGKQFSKMADHLLALIKTGAATKAQIARYEKITGKKAPKSDEY